MTSLVEDDPTDVVAGLELLPLAAVVLEGRVVVAANEAARRLAPGEPIGSSLLDWFEAEHRDDVVRALDEGTGHETVAARRAGRLDGWVALHTEPVADGLQVVLLRGALDERMVRAALDAVADSTFVLDPKGTSRWRSARLRERAGTSDEEAAASRAGERLHPEDMPLVFETFAKATPERPVSVVTRSKAVDDDQRWEWIEMVVRQRFAHEVLRGYLVQVHNLDEGRHVTTTLADADEDLLSLTEAAPVGIAVTDPAGHIVYRNPAARGLLGPDVESFGEGDWLALALPEHRGDLADAFGAALRQNAERTVTAAFGGEHAQPRWLRMRVRSQRGDVERPTGVIATIEDVTEQVEARAALEAAEERMRYLATHDVLTGLPNRAALTDELERAVQRHARAGSGLAVLFLDLDGFKPVNDSYGHAGGDRVLVEVAGRLRQAVREVDLVARHGGDEFVVLCEGTGSAPEVVEDLAGRLHDSIGGDILLDGARVRVGTSIGIALLQPGERSTADDLLLLADQAMYAAKAGGRGTTRVRRIDAAAADRRS